jgi:hypothetical protein
LTGTDNQLAEADACQWRAVFNCAHAQTGRVFAHLGSQASKLIDKGANANNTE